MAYGVTSSLIKSRYYVASTQTWSAWKKLGSEDDLAKYLSLAGGVSTGNIGAPIFALNKDGVSYGSLQSHVVGTETVTGVGLLALGNATPKGTNGNANGRIRLFGTNSGYSDIVPQGNNAGDALQIALPSASGTLLRKEDLTIDDEGYLVINLD